MNRINPHSYNLFIKSNCHGEYIKYYRSGHTNHTVNIGSEYALRESCIESYIDCHYIGVM